MVNLSTVQRVTVEVADWVVGDGEFGPAAVGDVVMVGLALVEIDIAERTDEAATVVTSAADGRCEVQGTLTVAVTSRGRTLPPVVRTQDLTLVLLGGIDGLDDGPVRLVGRLAVEPFHWAVTGQLWERFPDGVRPWRVTAIRTWNGDPATRVPAVDDGGGGESFLVDLETQLRS